MPDIEAQRGTQPDAPGTTQSGEPDRFTGNNALLPETDAALGLTETEAAQRLARFGENVLTEAHVSALRKLLAFFWGPIP